MFAVSNRIMPQRDTVHGEALERFSVSKTNLI